MTARRKAAEVTEFEFSLGDKADNLRWFSGATNPQEVAFILCGLEPPSEDDGEADYPERLSERYEAFVERQGDRIYRLIVRAWFIEPFRRPDRKCVLSWACRNEELQKYLLPRIKGDLELWKAGQLARCKGTWRLVAEQLIKDWGWENIQEAELKKQLRHILKSSPETASLAEEKFAELLKPCLEQVLDDQFPKGFVLPKTALRLIDLRCKSNLRLVLEDEYEYCVENSLCLTFKEFMSRSAIQEALSVYKANNRKAPTDKSCFEWYSGQMTFPTPEKDSGEVL